MVRKLSGKLLCQELVGNRGIIMRVRLDDILQLCVDAVQRIVFAHDVKGTMYNG